MEPQNNFPDLFNVMKEKGKRTFDVSSKGFSDKRRYEMIDTEISEINNIDDIKKRINKKLNLYENDLKAIRLLNRVEESIKKHQIDLDLIVERGENEENVYYIYGNNKALGKENILLNIPLNLSELEKLASLLSELFNKGLSLTGKTDFRHINDVSMMGKFNNFFSSNMLLKTRTRSGSNDIQNKEILRYNNNIAEEIFKFVSKLKGISEEKLNVDKSILNSGEGDSNYEKIGFEGNSELEKMINP